MSNPAAIEHAESDLAPRGRRHTVMHLLMLGATLAWAGNMVAGKEALNDFSALALTEIRVTGAALVLILIFAAWPKRPAIRYTAREWLGLVVMALFGTTFNQLFFIGGLARTTVAHTGLIVALGPVMVLALASLMRLEALTVLKLAGMAVSFIGVAVLTVGKVGTSDAATVKGDLIVLLSSAVFAYYTILVSKVADRYDPLTLNVLIYALGALFLFPIGAPALAGVKWSAVTPAGWFGAAYMVVLGSVVAYVIYALALTELTASRVAAFSYLQPVFAAALALWLLHERLTVSIVAGGALILIGVYMTERERGEEALPPQTKSANQ